MSWLQALWPMIADTLLEAPKYFSVSTLVECYEHIQAACTGLSSIRDLKRSLETMIGALLDPSSSYIQEIEQKLNTATALKASIIDALTDIYIFMDQVHNWSSSLTIKNQLVYLV